MRAFLLLLLGWLPACLAPGEPGNLVPKTVTEDPSLPAIELGGARFHAETRGPPGGPMIVVLHGGPGGDHRALLPLAALADDGYFVVFWDQRGSGLSQRFDARDITLDRYLEDLRDLIEHVTSTPAQPVVLVGHSWGAMYATWFIDTYGDHGGRVRGAVLSEPGAFTTAQLDAFLARQGSSIEILGEELGDIAWQEPFLTPYDHEVADYVDSLKAFIGQPADVRDPTNPPPFWRSGAIVRARMLDLAEREGFDWTRNLGAFQHPVLFLRGELNRAATLEHQQELAASYPRAEIVTMAGVGHAMHWERPEEYVAHIRAYLTTLDLEATP